MNTLKSLTYPTVALLSLAAAFAAHAEAPTVDFGVSQAGPSIVSRAEVRAEFLQARADGAITSLAAGYDPLLALPMQARDIRGLAMRRAAATPRLDASASVVGEDSGSFALSRSLTASPDGRESPARMARVTASSRR